MLLQRVNNHPVHILNNEGGLSPSSFIPFCSFGEEFIGTRINEFKIPVCNIFKPKPYFNQLCYETDLQELKDREKIKEQLKFGLTLVLDYNEERQFKAAQEKESHHLIDSIYQNDVKSFALYIDTISNL